MTTQRRKSRLGGTAVFRPAGGKRVGARAAKRSNVLIVLHSDGYAEVYAAPRDAVKVRVVNLLATDRAEEVLAEKYLDIQLGPHWSEIRVPGNLVATGSVGECRSVAAEVDRVRGVGIIRGLTR